MSDVALSIRQDLTAPTPATSEASSIVSIIERAASDPRVDVDKLMRLMEMRDAVMAKEAEKVFNVAMKDAQSEMRPIGADAPNSQTKSKYATYAKLDSVLRPIYTRHGFSLSFDEADSPKPEHIRVLCYVSHEGGHTRTYRKDMPADGKGAKGGDVMTKTHATGAAASYGARYLIKGIFNIAVGEEDRDGNAVEEPASKITEDQVMELRDLLLSVEADEAKFLQFIKVERLDDIFADKFADAKALILRKGQRS